MDWMDTIVQLTDISRPELAEAAAALAQGDKTRCAEEIIRHFRTRTDPRYLFTAEDLRKNADDHLIEDAEEVMNRTIYGYTFPGEIDWHFNPTTDAAHDNEWSWSLYRFIFWQPLARAYVQTGDERYPAEALSQLRGFLKAWPLSDFLADEEGYIKQHQYPSYPWRHIETAMRLYTAFLPCLCAFRESKAFDEEGWALYLSAVKMHADYLVTHYTNHEKSSNWLTMESGALLQTAIMFPELDKDQAWFRHGYQRVMHEMRYSFDNDGVHMERTSIYHMVAAISYFQCTRLCELNGIPVPPYAKETLSRACEFILRQLKPDFSTPMIGDADRDDLLARRSDTSVYEGMNLSMDPFDLNEMRAWFRQMAQWTGRGDFLWVATGRKHGHAPTERNFSMKEAGIHIMRTGWGAEDSYMHIHGVQLERGEKSTHSHNDTGHFELQIAGEDILLDGGRYIYNQSIWKNWRHYFTGALAHNTLYCDDLTMGAVPGVSRVRGVRLFLHRFEENEQYAVIDVSHNGYVFTDDPVYHRRAAVRLEKDVYVLDDRITGLGLADHDFRLTFNFAPGKLTGEGMQYRYETPKGRQYSFTAACDAEMLPSVLEGSEDPIGGWVSYGYSLRVPAPQLTLQRQGKAPFRCITVIAPAGCRAEIGFNGDEAVIHLNGTYHTTLILAGDRIERKEEP
ncbi:MAG: alginate lyase family protein [Clostridia bacterium]|nr:alginate lyase family protein [Clostridia bacterium]